MMAPLPSPPHGGPARTCPFCSHAHAGAPDRCRWCGTPLGDAAASPARAGEAERRLLRTRKAMADTEFLVGLLLGGPMISFGHDIPMGAFIVLAGGLISVLRRYTAWSHAGTVLVGALASLVVAALVVSPATRSAEDTLAGEAARAAYARALDAGDELISVEARGPALVAIWFTIPTRPDGACGDYPPTELRAHLAMLGFLRVVVTERNRSGGLCSFAP